jgi:hypothetical protein
MHTSEFAKAHAGSLRVGRSVALQPVYRGKRTPPSEATLAKRAQEAREAARGTCSCGMALLPTGSCPFGC